jgi:regulatory protein
MKSKPVKQPRKISRQYLENAGLYYLQRYATSAENFRQVMTRKIKRSCAFHEVSPEDFYPLLEDMITRYLAVGLLNDSSFAQAKTSTLRRQGRSKQSIFARLQAKGLSKTDIAAAIATADAEKGDDAEFDAARTMARRKKLGPWRICPVTDIKDRQKEMATLARAGFSYDIARRVLESEDQEVFD